MEGCSEDNERRTFTRFFGFALTLNFTQIYETQARKLKKVRNVISSQFFRELTSYCSIQNANKTTGNPANGTGSRDNSVPGGAGAMETAESGERGRRRGREGWQEAVIRPYQTIPDSFAYFQMFSDTYVHHINTFSIYSDKFEPLQKLEQDLSKFSTGSETCSKLSFSQMISDHFAVGLHWGLSTKAVSDTKKKRCGQDSNLRLGSELDAYAAEVTASPRANHYPTAPTVTGDM